MLTYSQAREVAEHLVHDYGADAFVVARNDNDGFVAICPASQLRVEAYGRIVEYISRRIVGRDVRLMTDDRKWADFKGGCYDG